MLQGLRMPKHQDLGMLRTLGMVKKSLGPKDAASPRDGKKKKNHWDPGVLQAPETVNEIIGTQGCCKP